MGWLREEEGESEARYRTLQCRQIPPFFPTLQYGLLTVTVTVRRMAPVLVTIPVNALTMAGRDGMDGG